MPGGRRNAAGRAGPNGRSGNSYAGSANVNGRSNSGERAVGSGVDDRRIDEIYGGKSLAPKHVPIPVVPVDGQLTFEALSLAISIIAACLQLLNLYRTVWWLPHSYNNYSMVCYSILLHTENYIGTDIFINSNFINNSKEDTDYNTLR